MRPAASVWLTALSRRGLCWCGLAMAGLNECTEAPIFCPLWGPCGLEGGIRITYCTGCWRVNASVCVFVSVWLGGGWRGSGGVLITASYQVTCKCVIGLNFLMYISPISEAALSVGRFCHCVKFSKQNSLPLCFHSILSYYLQLYSQKNPNIYWNEQINFKAMNLEWIDSWRHFKPTKTQSMAIMS